MPVRLTTIGILTLAIVASLLLWAPGASGQLEVTLIVPEDGAVLAEPPPLIHMCFGSPINILDLDKGGDFDFRVQRPDGRLLGLRIVFQFEGFGADVYPGIHGELMDGEWMLKWRVTDAETLEPTEGIVTYTVSPEGIPVSEEPPGPCPAINLTADTSPTPDSGVTAGREDGDDGPDFLLVALVITSAAVGAAVIGLLLYLLRLRIGFWLHRPPPSEGADDSD